MPLNSLPLNISDPSDQTNQRQVASHTVTHNGGIALKALSATAAPSHRLQPPHEAEYQAQDNTLVMESSSENASDYQEYLEDDWGQELELDLSDDDSDGTDHGISEEDSGADLSSGVKRQRRKRTNARKYDGAKESTQLNGRQ